MSNISRLKIITELGELVYKDPKDLNITFNRIVDDFTDIGNRFGDFSYTFNLPIVKQNSLVFGSPEAKGSKGYFKRNQNISCQVYLNNQLLLDGIINLEGVTRTEYQCAFYSKFTELIDTLSQTNADGDEITLKDLNFAPIDNWDYETSIIKHIRANYKNSDETDYQYPLSFYSTMFCAESVYTGENDDRGNAFRNYTDYQNFYFTLNSVDSDVTNRIYHHQMPPAIYIVSIVRQILSDAGWSLGGQFFNQENVKKILLLYSGEDDIYDQATGIISGHTTPALQLAKFLPDMSQSEFLQGIMNTFNLYFKIDLNNQILFFETYNTYFKDTDGVDPYDISGKIDLSDGSPGFSYFQPNNPTIMFEESLNRFVFGDNEVMTGSTDNGTTQVWKNVSSKLFNQMFNHVGSSEDEIEVPFSEPTIKKHWIYNDIDIDGTPQGGLWQRVYLPLLSEQTKVDNGNMLFNKKDDETFVFNSEDRIKFKGKGSLMYYYGIPTTDFENRTGDGPLSNFLYFNMYTGATPERIPIPVVSPFQLADFRTAIDAWQAGIVPANLTDRRTVIASYLQSVWHMMGTAAGVPSGKTTEYSLVFDDSGYLHNTLWSVFHKYKWDRYQQSEMFTGGMVMNSFDWAELQIDRPILYNNELYSLVSIEGYNPITQRCELKMIKKL